MMECDVGLDCLHCGEGFTPGERWLPINAGAARVHVECMTRMVGGGVNHLRGTCRCFGGTDDPDPPGMTVREAARAAREEWLRRTC